MYILSQFYLFLRKLLIGQSIMRCSFSAPQTRHLCGRIPPFLAHDEQGFPAGPRLHGSTGQFLVKW